MKLLAKLANCEFVRLAGQGINLLNSVLVMVLDKEANAASKHWADIGFMNSGIQYPIPPGCYSTGDAWV